MSRKSRVLHTLVNSSSVLFVKVSPGQRITELMIRAVNRDL